jgi:uncharacterized protein with PQ loop repeat
MKKVLIFGAIVTLLVYIPSFIWYVKSGDSESASLTAVVTLLTWWWLYGCYQSEKSGH